MHRRYSLQKNDDDINPLPGYPDGHSFLLVMHNEQARGKAGKKTMIMEESPIWFVVVEDTLSLLQLLQLFLSQTTDASFSPILLSYRIISTTSLPSPDYYYHKLLLT